MSWSPCESADCPVAEPTPGLLRRLRTTTVHAGTLWWRGSQHAPDTLATGSGDTRFAPLPGTSHGYFGATRTVALLESALHELSGPDPSIYLADLTGWTVSKVSLTAHLRLVDLRDPELARLGVARSALVDTTARHYPCTREWAIRLQHRRPGGHDVAGALWHSRQADLHARARPGGLLADVLIHSPAEVAVAWHPSGPATPFRTTPGTDALVVDGRPTRLVQELSALVGAPIE